MLRLYRDLISLRKQWPSLGNCRKDLTEIQFDDQAKTLVMKRTDPAGGSALLILNFSTNGQSVSTAGDSQARRLLLWTGDQVYGGSLGPRPLETLAPGPTFRLSLATFEAVIYVI
jgi:hypothetical protein